MSQSEIKHDPGGKVRRALSSYIRGEESFSDCRRFRPWLKYSWDKGEGTALVCAMNPSVAEARFADPTVAKVRDYVEHMLGYSALIMTNVIDYRSTSPDRLRDTARGGETVNSADNHPAILEAAKRADKIILAHGNLHPVLQPYAVEITRLLFEAGHELMCWGFNKNGSPKHPLYLRKNAPLQPYTLKQFDTFARS